MPPESWVYFLREGEDPSASIKIGTTTDNPHARRKKLQTGNSRVLTLLVAIRGTPADEKALHARFSALRIRPDGEWFRAEEPPIGFVDGLKWAYRDQQPAPADPDDLHGFSRDQCMALMGFIETRICVRAAKAAIQLIRNGDTSPFTHAEAERARDALKKTRDFLLARDPERQDDYADGALRYMSIDAVVKLCRDLDSAILDDRPADAEAAARTDSSDGPDAWEIN